MKRHWTRDDLVEHFTLSPQERALVATMRHDHTRLGLAVLLKSFQLDGRFPRVPYDVPGGVVNSLPSNSPLLR